MCEHSSISPTSTRRRPPRCCLRGESSANAQLFPSPLLRRASCPTSRILHLTRRTWSVLTALPTRPMRSVCWTLLLAGEYRSSPPNCKAINILTGFGSTMETQHASTQSRASLMIHVARGHTANGKRIMRIALTQSLRTRP